MMYDPEKHNRRTIRLKGYDYSLPGMYFVTICVYRRKCLLGDVSSENVQLTQFGQIAQDFWESVPQHFPSVSVDCFIVMPNHVHAVIQIHDMNSRRNANSPSSTTLGQIIAYYKYSTTKQINQIRDSIGVQFWQKRFYDHIVRNEEELDLIRHYIVNNHLKWEEDQDNPSNWDSK